MNKYNFVIVFNLGGEKAYLSRHTGCRGEESYQRSKEYEYGFHEFKDVEGFKASVQRYTAKYGAPTKVILNGIDIEGYKAATLAQFIINEAI